MTYLRLFFPTYHNVIPTSIYCVCYKSEIQSFKSKMFFFIITYFFICFLNLYICQLCVVSNILFSLQNLGTIELFSQLS